MVDAPSQEKLFIETELPEPLYVSSFNIFGTGTDMGIVLSRPHPSVEQLSSGAEGRGTLKIVGVLAMSPQSAKDLAVLLTETVAGYEREFGPLTTSFTRSRATSSK